MGKTAIFGLSTLIIVALILIPLAAAQAGEDFSEAQALIEQKVPCNQLSFEQLEKIGEYYMEQMHPGESHELMHEMMGLEEGSEAEKQFHINMAKRLYCNEGGTSGSGGVNMMGSGMMGGGMIGGMMGGAYSGSGMMGSGYSGGMMGPQMMYGAYGYNSGLLGGSLGALNEALFTLALIALIIFLSIKIFRELKGGKKNGCKTQRACLRVRGRNSFRRGNTAARA